MTVLTDTGDEIRGETIVCVCRKSGRPELIHATGGHKGIRLAIKGLPAVARIEKSYRLLVSL
ncbi:MAG: hypothetical protein HYW25_03380 [Candidatus Aenigmarchaeota archaeon]|nr:hypothetical protein [Candidatus Aenigmarchaeota archaeon]